MKEFSLESAEANKIKMSKLGITSVVVGIFFIVVTLLTRESCGLYRLINSCILNGALLMTVTLSVLALVLIKRSNGKIKGRSWAIAGLILFGADVFLLYAVAPYKGISASMVCGANMSRLGKAIFIYANESDGEFPSADNWCDLLLQHTEAEEADFQCRESFWPVFSYGFNKNLDGRRISEVAPSTVVLFEIKGGRNVSGGPELLVADKHNGGGSNVLFGDSRVEFVKAEDIGKLNWGAKNSSLKNE